MAAPIIKVENLSKLYRLGKKDEQATTLIQAAARFASAPLRNFRKLRSLTNFDDAANATDILWALRDVSFEVAPGEVVGLIGRNGAGKSTLLKILSRIMPPTRGRVEIRGRLASLLEVGTGFHPELSGRDNVFLNGAILGMTRREIVKKFDEIVAFAEIEKFIDTPVKRYSSGMYVRLAFAVAAHLEPDILVVDEVLAVGDAAFQKKCLGKMRSVSQNEGRTILFVSHNMGAVSALCSQAIWFEKGAIANAGPAREIVDRYMLMGRTNAGIIDFEQVPLTNPRSTKFCIKSLTINKGCPIYHGEPFNVQIDFETLSAVLDVSLGFGLCTTEGVRIMTIDTDLREPARSFPSQYKGSVTLTMDRLDVEPGLYLVDVGARSGDHHGLEYFPQCTQLQVLPGPSTPPSIVNRLGGLRIPTQCMWQEK